MKLKKINSEFNEIYKKNQDLINHQDFRNKIVEFENKLKNSGLALSDEDLHKLNPVKHFFADGCYIREIFSPANQLLVSKIHKKEHPFFLMEGELSILTEKGVQHLKAPYNGITKPGTKRIIYTHTDCKFITVHATDKTDIDEIEQDVIAKDFTDPQISLEELKILTKKINKQ